MGNIQIYLPIDRRLALSRGEPLPATTQGTALFADISGFTPLTAAYVDTLGPALGAEELIQQINQVYDALICEVHRFGGAVIYFSGDAITCWFDENAELGMMNDEPQNIQHSALRATACALAMQARMQAFSAVSLPRRTTAAASPARLPTAEETIAITIKITLAAGPARRFLVGDPAIQRLDILTGNVLTRIATAERLAQPGEIVADSQMLPPDVYQIPLAGTSFALVQGLKREVAACPWPPLPTEHHLTDEVIKTWLLRPVYDRLNRGAEHFLSELRPVVPLFLKFSGLDYEGDASVGEKLDAYLCWVQRMVGHFDGYMLQVTVGDKGSYLYAAFGAPIAHEDDADRALRAAIALRTLPADLTFIKSFHIGISRGPMRVGAYGGSNRRAYGAIGQETNIAARLMSHAQPGEIVVSQRVVDALRHRAAFQLTSLGELILKGSTRAIPAYTVQRATERMTTVTQFAAPGETALLFGREVEAQQLQETLERFLAGESGIVAIEGEAGIGKSRLVQDLLARARQTTVLLLLSEGNAIEQASPYYAWRQIFSQLFQLDTLPDEVTARQEYVQQWLPDDPTLLEMAPLLNTVLPLELPETELTQAMTGLSRANKTQQVVTAILQQVARTTPLLIVVEDAHWLDSTSWAMFEAAHRAVKPLLLVLVTRLRPLEGALPSLLNEPAVQRIRLKSLSTDSTLRIACQCLGVTTLPSAVAAFITERAEGHPFFCEELVYALRDARLIEVKDGVCYAAPDAGNWRNLDFPDTIEGVVTSRIDRLDPAQQLALKVSSVIGRVFTFNTLQAIHPVETLPARLRNYLAELNRLDITLLQTPEPDLAYLFKHIITQQVVYSMLLFSQRRELHRKVAEWYEQTYPDDRDNLSPLLAYHWYQAVDLAHVAPALAQKAIDYGEVAGDRAIRSYANEEAIHLFSGIQTLAAHLPDKTIIPKIRQAHWELQLGEACLGLGQLPESRRHFEQCLLLLGYSIPPAGSRMAVGLVLEVVRRLGWKRPHSRPPSPEQKITLQTAARACELLGHIFYFTNQTIPTLFAMIRGLNLAEQVGEGTPELARAYGNMSGAVALAPLFKQSLVFEEKAWQTVQTLHDLPTLAYVSFITSVPKINIANWEGAKEGYDKALALATQLGDWNTACICISGNAHIAFYRGYFQQSMVLFEQLAALGETSQNVSNWSVGVGGMGGCYFHQAKWAETLACIEKSLALSRIGGITLVEWNNRSRLALTQFYMGQYEAARETAEAAFPYASRAPHTSFANTVIYSDLIMTLLLLWEQSAASGIPAKAQTLAKRYRQYTRIFPFARPTSCRLSGIVAWLNGRPASAHKLWQRALSEARRLQMPYEEGLAHYEIGRHLSPTDPIRSYHLDQANYIFADLGAIHALRQLQKVQEETL